jgi:hypothetical protein
MRSVNSRELLSSSRSEIGGRNNCDGAAPRSGEVKFPLTINVQDAKENIWKMKLQLEVAKPELIQKKVDQS